MCDLLRRVRPDAVVHLAAQSSISASWQNPSRTMQVNVEGTAAVLEATEAIGGARLVFASSVDVYGDVGLPLREDAPTVPVSPYGISKLAAERCIEAFAGAGGWEAVTLRLGTVFGPGQDERRLIPALVERGFRGDALSVVPVTRDFVHVTDAVEAIVLALVRGTGVVNVAGGEEVPLPSLAQTVRALTRPDARIDIAGGQAHPDVRRVHCDLTRAADQLGWSPTVRLEEGLRELVHAPAVA
jgi:nucleoside-diphosphate-sugar epimerase